MQQEVRVPSDDGRYRAFTGDGAIRFEPVAMAPVLLRLGFSVVLLFSVLPLGGYVTAALWLYHNGESMPWGVHALGLGFALLCVVTLGHHALDNHGFQSSSVIRRANGALELHYGRTGGRTRIYTIAEPACLMAVLRQELGGTTGWRRVQDATGATHRERFADRVTVGLYLKASDASPHMAFQPRGWLQLLPDELDLRHKHYEPEENLAVTVAALRPLAEAFEQVLGVKARYHVAGRGPVHLERVHGEAPTILDGSAD